MIYWVNVIKLLLDPYKLKASSLKIFAHFWREKKREDQAECQIVKYKKIFLNVQNLLIYFWKIINKVLKLLSNHFSRYTCRINQIREKFVKLWVKENNLHFAVQYQFNVYIFIIKGADGNMYTVYLFIAKLEWKGIHVPVGTLQHWIKCMLKIISIKYF